MKATAAAVQVKKARLRAALQRCGSVLVAFSGGKDSFFLLREAIAALGQDRVVPFFVATPFNGTAARSRLDYFREHVPVPVRELRLDLLSGPRLRRNPRERCFICKQRMFVALKKEAARLGIAVVADGSTASDRTGHRPGRRALEMLGIASPLRAAGFTAGEIAGDLARSGIDRFFLSPSTCLATRFPYGHRLDPREMLRIAQVEEFLAARDVFPLRVRYIPDGVRVEAEPRHFRKILALKDDLLAFCRERDFLFVTLDLGGIKSGPWDKARSARKAKGKSKKVKVRKTALGSRKDNEERSARKAKAK